MVQLDERLSLVERMAGRCERLVDVGTNHGYLPVHMLQNGRCARALLCDISMDALSRAEALVEKTQLQSQTEFRVVDGLSGAQLGTGDVVTICGMGARTIAHILHGTLPCPVVMQANVELRYLRRHVQQIGMHIENEDIALDNGRFYVVMRAESGSAEPLNEYEEHIGPLLLRRRPPLLRPYLEWRLGVAKRAYEGMAVGRDADKRERAKRDVEDVQRALEEIQ